MFQNDYQYFFFPLLSWRYNSSPHFCKICEVKVTRRVQIYKFKNALKVKKKMALRHKLLNLKTGRILYKQPECIWIYQHKSWSFFFLVGFSTNLWSLYRNPLGVSVPSPPIILVPAAAAPIVMSAAASAVMLTVATPVFLLVIVVPAVAVLLVTAGTRFICEALISAAAVHLGTRMLIGGVGVLPWAPSARISTCRRLPLQRLGEAAIQLPELLHVELPHHVVHLRIEDKTDNRTRFYGC